MKTALCYSGQIGAFDKAISSQKKSFLSDCDDIYAYTSNVISHKTHKHVWHKPSSNVYEYLKSGEGWRKNTTDYGVVYKVDNNLVKDQLSPVKDKLKDFHIMDECLDDTLEDWNMSKWEWLRKRQLNKLYRCNEMLKDSDTEYDIVVRCRFEFSPHLLIPIKHIYSKHGGENVVFLFGGWKCVPPMVFMDEFICDGFAFGSPRVMDVFSSLYLRSEPYPYNPKYKECWEKFGDNVEYQLRTHLEENGIEIIYLGNERSMYHLHR